MTVADLPALNACLNGLAGVLLLFGRNAIKTKEPSRIPRHRALMVAALATSAAFLSSYLYYHFNVELVTQYAGQGFLRWIYYSVLATHVPLAGLMVPFIAYAVVKAARGEFAKHKRVVRYLWPVWMYVSVTGVVIYLMLYVLPGGKA